MFSQEHHTKSLFICQAFIEKMESIVYTIVGTCRKEGVEMIFVRLNHLMSNKRLKIADVCKDTKKSRPTLTALYYGTSKGMNFDTINKLCSYFRCSIEDLLYFYDVEIDTLEITDIDEKQLPKDGKPNHIPLQLQDCYPAFCTGEIRFKSSIASIGRVSFSLACNTDDDERFCDTEIDLRFDENGVMFPYLPDDLRGDFARNISNMIICKINKKYPNALPIDYSLGYYILFNPNK